MHSAVNDAELKLLDTASSFKSMQHLTNVELSTGGITGQQNYP
jgi:hypothetical protein